jgi:hypothetical protein
MANTRRMNRLEELGRVDSEKAKTRMGKKNLKDEKKRIVRELKKDGGKVKKVFPTNPSREQEARDYYTKNFGSKKAKAELSERTRDRKKVQKADGGRTLKPVDKSKNPGLAKLPTKVRNKMGYMKKGGRVGMGKAMRGGGCVR